MQQSGIANNVLGGLSDTEPGPQKASQLSPKVAGETSCLGAFPSTFAEKYALEKEVFFRSLPRVFVLSDF